MMRVHCCKDCTNRVVGCHATCEKYIQAKENNEKLRHQVNLKRNADFFLRDSRMDKHNRLIKKYGKSTN